MKRAMIAMSGGVDSSVAAYLMVQAGYDCLGMTMRLYNNEDIGKTEKTCCSLDDVEDARSVAFRLGIPFRVFNFTEEFRSCVIDRFVNAYECGETPNPCIDCNKYLKFGKIFQRMDELGYDYVVTGHYARIEQDGDRFLLKKGLDDSKDQSYVLYGLTQAQLARTVFPLGGMTKAETRRIAEEQGFLNARKHDSQDICFVPDGDYAAFLERYTGKSYPAGEFVDTQGKILGRHKGIVRYTIGQRKGLGLALPCPMYVKDKDMAGNRVILSKNEELFSRELDAKGFNWSALDCPSGTIRASAKIRYKHTEQPASVTPTGPDTVHIVFDEPQRAICRGQAVVLYDGDTVLGGGTII
ncbi:MAG: tRNA 2-thiouridine(34) synthase MnmA [Oscillospiraceae bacterium]|nr:tRNA 2-thiouridine(34) synthase MnmA [Oscillospiraceae bacterium]